jgi:hypothetical protein
MAERELSIYHRQRSADVETFNRSQLGVDREAEIRHLNRRFSKITRRYERAIARGRHRLMVMRYISRALIGAAVGASIYLAIWLMSPWPVGLTIKHVVAGINCKSARTVGLAPARRGNPGYWPRNDADNDGIACEPWPRGR